MGVPAVFCLFACLLAIFPRLFLCSLLFIPTNSKTCKHLTLWFSIIIQWRRKSSTENKFIFIFNTLLISNHQSTVWKHSYNFTLRPFNVYTFNSTIGMYASKNRKTMLQGRVAPLAFWYCIVMYLNVTMQYHNCKYYNNIITSTVKNKELRTERQMRWSKS